MCGQPMLTHSLDLLKSLSLNTTVVLGYQAQEVAQQITAHFQGHLFASIALQNEQKGTGHAVRCAQELLTGDQVLILNGDMPLLTQEVLSSLLGEHATANNTITFCTTKLDNPSGYGRVCADAKGIVLIREEKECSDMQRKITIVNAGVYVVQKDFLIKSIQSLTASAITGELYITDIIADAAHKGEKVGAYEVESEVVRGVNTLEELAVAEVLLYSRIRRHHMHHGVRFIDPASTLVEKQVRIGCGSVIGRGVHLQGDSILHKNVHVGPYSIITDTVLHQDAVVHAHSVIEHSVVQKEAQVGPFARLRGHADIGEKAVIGNFVEVKKSQIASGAKAKHLSYVGDATVGERANIGAGSITCNYDGQVKHQTRIGAGAMIGANTSLVAPVSIGAQSYIAAGSTITRDVPSGALGIGRARQIVKQGWAKTRRIAGLLHGT